MDYLSDDITIDIESLKSNELKFFIQLKDKKHLMTSNPNKPNLFCINDTPFLLLITESNDLLFINSNDMSVSHHCFGDFEMGVCYENDVI